jgi:hypothetical protein
MKTLNKKECEAGHAKHLKYTKDQKRPSKSHETIPLTIQYFFVQVPF